MKRFEMMGGLDQCESLQTVTCLQRDEWCDFILSCTYVCSFPAVLVYASSCSVDVHLRCYGRAFILSLACIALRDQVDMSCFTFEVHVQSWRGHVHSCGARMLVVRGMDK